MKKFIIVIVFVFLIAILISFNYLLWDREKQLANYQDLSDAKNLSIDTLGEKINNLDKQNRELAQRITTLEQEKADLKSQNYELISEKQKILQDIDSRKGLIRLLKSSINTEPFETAIKKWVEAVNSKNYKTAMSYVSKESKDKILSGEENLKTACQSELKAISLKTSKLYNELTDDEHLSKIQFQVVFEVDKPEPASESKGGIPQLLFKNGENVKYLTMEVDPETGESRISELSDKP